MRTHGAGKVHGSHLPLSSRLSKKLNPYIHIYYHTYILHTKFETNIVLVHGAYVDGSSWGKVITILKSAGYHVIAVQLPLHSLADDVATVKRTIQLVGGPIVLVGHSYGGFAITNAAYNNVIMMLEVHLDEHRKKSCLWKAA